MSDDEDDHEVSKLRAPPDFDGPTKHRRCTDVLCLGLIILMWVLMTALGSYAVSHGDYRIILYPLDYEGNICGTNYANGNMSDFPYLYHVNNYGGGVCVKECPSLANHTSDGLTDVRTLITYSGVWQTSGAELPANFVQVADYSNSSNAVNCTENLCFPVNSTTASWLSPGVAGGFSIAYYVGDSFDILSRCYLTLEAEQRILSLVGLNITVDSNSTTANVFKNGERFWSNLYGDLYSSRAYIFGFGFGVAFGVSLLYTLLLRIPFLLTSVIWGSIFLTLSMFYAVGFFAYKKADHFQHQNPRTFTDKQIQGFRIFSYIMWVVGVFLTLVACCLRNQIQLAIGCVKEAAKAVESMILIFLVPVLQAIALLIFIAVFLVYAVYLASLGKIITKPYPLNPLDPTGPSFVVRSYTFNEFTFKSAWFLIFCLYWTGNFIVAIGDVIVSMSVAKWYFTRNKLLVTSLTVVGSVLDTCLYHLGTCAYGSFILAVVQWLRTFLAYIQDKMKKMHNIPANIVLCCCQCCLWCLEKCIKFMNKNAYIQTAIFGYSFCRAARAAFFLILRNFGRISAISYVSSAILIIGKLFICVVTTAVAYFAIVDQIGHKLHSVVGPLVVIFFMAYLISDMFMGIFHMAISTILQCFIADEEMFSGDEAYAEGDLKAWVDKHSGMFG